MLAEYRKKTQIGVILGLLVMSAGVFASQPDLVGIGPATTWARTGGWVVMTWGCWNWAKGKGYHGAWGLLGLLIVFFPDQHKGPGARRLTEAEKDAGGMVLAGAVLGLLSIFFISGPGKDGVGGVSFLILPGYLWGWLFLIAGAALVVGGIVTFTKGRRGGARVKRAR